MFSTYFVVKFISNGNDLNTFVSAEVTQSFNTETYSNVIIYFKLFNVDSIKFCFNGENYWCTHLTMIYVMT